MTDDAISISCSGSFLFLVDVHLVQVQKERAVRFLSRRSPRMDLVLANNRVSSPLAASDDTLLRPVSAEADNVHGNDDVVAVPVVPYEKFHHVWHRVCELGRGQFGRVDLWCPVATDDVIPHREGVAIQSPDPSPLVTTSSQALVPYRPFQNGTTMEAWNAVAVKTMLPTDDDDVVQMERKWRREVFLHAWVTYRQLQTRRSHTCIVPPLLALVVHDEQSAALSCSLVTTPVRGGTLEDELEKAQAMCSLAERRRLHGRRWSEGDRILEWLHAHCQVVHGDAHTGNFLIDAQDGRLLLGDFGEARHAGHFLPVSAAVPSSPTDVEAGRAPLSIQVEQDDVSFLSFGSPTATAQSVFLLLAGYERLTFRFDTALDRDDKQQLGRRLCRMEERLPPRGAEDSHAAVSVGSREFFSLATQQHRPLRIPSASAIF